MSHLCSGPVQHGSAGSRTTMESKMSGRWMTSTSASSVLTCATDTAGVTMDTAGQPSHTHTLTRTNVKHPEVLLYYFFNITQHGGP